ncbi:zinc finger MYM-type protein 1-like [Dysidea avara]|uniref:zinc finger MYM-type protein 1-like n=1 Tax=Dysidea avara TaxID=196820 RepID=UPI00331C1E2E
MDKCQRRIVEFVASKKKAASTGARPNSTTQVIIIDDSDRDSDSQEMDTIEATTFSSVSADVPVRQLDEDSDEDVENEEEIQLIPQVSAVTQQSREQLSEETVSQVDSPSSNLVGTPEISISVARNTASDSATVCSTSDGCGCVGCSDLTRPNQPLDVSKSKCMQSHLSKERQLGQKKQYNRSIQTSWYNKYPWITVCTGRYKIYCRICCLAKQHGLLSTSVLKNSSFIGDGFGNWNKALERFHMHENSDMHREAVERLQLRESSIHIGCILDTRAAPEQEFHRSMLLKLLRAIKFLGKQGLAIRGHNENAEAFQGNLYQLLLLQAEDCPGMNEWLRQREYISPTIVDELIKSMGKSILRDIISEVSSAPWYAIIADEATDVSGTEQVSVSVRWVNNCYEVHEDLLGLKELPNTKAVTIHHEIKDVLMRCSLSISQCRGQAYDGASNMSGIRNGAQALFKQEEPKALYVHCLAHSLNLCVQDVSKKCKLLRNTLDFIYNLVQLIKFSPKRLNLFETLKSDVTVNTGETLPSLRTLCPTRWTVRHGAIASVLKNYKVLLTALDTIQEGHDEYAAKASGLLNRMEQFDTFFGLKLAHQIFAPAEQCSTNIQAVNITVQEAMKAANVLISHLRSIRNESTFNCFYERVIHESQSLTAEPKLPRIHKLPRRLDHGSSAPHQHSCTRDMYRQTYYEAIDTVSEEVKRRFDQSDIQLIRDIETLLLTCANGTGTDSLSQALVRFLEGDVDVEHLKVQLRMLPDAIKTALNGTIKRVTNVRTIADAMMQSEIYQNMLCEVNKVLLLYFTFPVTTSTAERSFSSLRRIKTYLRNTISACKLNNLLLMHVHQHRTDKLDLVSIAREFISVNSRRMNYFGKTM